MGSFMLKKTFLALSFALSFYVSQLPACTGLLVNAKDGSAVSGRTVEFGTPLDMSVAIIPRNYTFEAEIPEGKGMAYTSKYAAAGVYCFKNKVLMDGMNEKGLVAAAFYFPGYAQYAKVTNENKNHMLSPVEFPNWILSQFGTIEEVKQALKSTAIGGTVVQGWGNEPPPMHYIVYDKSGKSIVIEPINGALVVNDNMIGTITNSPNFEWHIKNLVNFINLSPYNAESVNMRGLKLTSFGQGSGLVGLPGDFSPPSRFVRATIFAVNAIPPEKSSGLVNQAFHLLNQFDIPYGSVREQAKEETYFDHTLLTSVKDPVTLRYYYKSYDDQMIRYVDLSQFDLNSKKIISLSVNGSQRELDMTSMLK